MRQKIDPHTPTYTDIYNINTNYIGGLGHSKGQYSVTRLSAPNNSATSEDLILDGEPGGTPEPQPYPGFSSRISVGYQSMGMGLFRPQYITPDYAPTILACGDYDRAAIVFDGHKNFLKYLQKLDVNHIEIFMKELGHELPHGYDEEQGFDRYKLMHDFFDRYLKVEENLPPTVLVMSPPDKSSSVLPSDNITVHFAPVMDENSITNGSGVKIIRLKDNTQVKGKWKTLYKKTRFVFTPEQKLRENEKYKIIITTCVKNKNGTNLDKEKIAEFTVTKK
ncbi:Ig-like domain-containing protein [bacterium]|nr:Ig-like domain-containing protein [bacterium]